MNILDIAIVVLFILFLLAGWYRGFLSTVLSLGAYLLSCILALVFMPMLSGNIKGNADLYNTMLYYTEGAEYVTAVNVELSRLPISELSAEELTGVMQAAQVPSPIGQRIAENIAKESFVSSGVTTLGEYFNQTIVCVFINILSFLLQFVVIRAVFSFIIHGIDFARKGYPVLHTADGIIASGAGLLRGFLAMFLLFTAVPIFLVVLPEFVLPYIEESVLGEFFYQSNFLLRFIPGV